MRLLPRAAVVVDEELPKQRDVKRLWIQPVWLEQSGKTSAHFKMVPCLARRPRFAEARFPLRDEFSERFVGSTLNIFTHKQLTFLVLFCCQGGSWSFAEYG
jgi:hypothetical protein